MIGAIRRFREVRAQVALDGLLAGTGLLTAAEGINRVTRIFAVISLARYMSVAEFATAAAALATFEILRMFIQNGIGTRIVTASCDDLERVASAVHRLNWGLGIGLAAIQTVVAVPVALWFGSAELAAAIVVLASVHAIYPLAMVQVYLSQRSQAWRVIGGGIAGAAAIENLSTAALVFGGAGIWSVVVPKILVASAWICWHRYHQKWLPVDTPTADDYQRLLSFGSRILGAELLASLRFHADKGIVALAFGPVAFGLYVFAGNIGRGIALSVSASLGSLVLPHLARGRESGGLGEAFKKSLAVALLTTVPFALTLAATAHWLVPIVLGDKWAPAVGLVAILAIGSASQPAIVTVSQLLRSVDRPGCDFALSAAATGATLGGLVLGLPFGLETAVTISAAAQVLVGIAAVVGGLYVAQCYCRETACVGGVA